MVTRLAFAFPLVNGRAVIGLYYLRLPIAEATFKRVFLFSSVCLMDIFNVIYTLIQCITIYLCIDQFSFSIGLRYIVINMCPTGL